MDIKKLLFFLILILSAFLRLYKLESVPPGLYQDETAIGYNAYSILKTGKDEYGNSFPLYFKSFGDYKLPVYIYLTTLSERVFGVNEFAVRFPSAFFGILSAAMIYFYVKKLSNSSNIAIFSMLFLALTPWHLHYSRATFEVSIGLFLFLLGGFLMHMAMTEKKRGLFIAATVLFIINIYSYNLTRLLSPMLYFFLIFYYRKEWESIKKTEKASTLVLSIILLLPFVFSLFSSGGISSASGTLLFSSPVIQARILEFKSYIVDLPLIVNKTLFNQAILSSFIYLQNVFSYLSVDFFFINGSSHGNHGIGNNGNFYLFQLPLIIAGIHMLVTRKLKHRGLYIGWSIIAILVAGLTREAPQATRSFFLLFPFTAFSVYGLVYFWKIVMSLKLHYIKEIYIALCSSIALYSIFFYFASYYFRFPVLYQKQWRKTDKDVALYIKENEGKYQKIIFDKNAGFIYTSFLFYTQYPPQEFYSSVKRARDDAEGFSRVLSFGKYVFKDVDWQKDYFNSTEKVLIITNNNQKPNEAPPLQTYYFAKRPVVIPVNGEIAQYPIEDISYVLVEKR